MHNQIAFESLHEKTDTLFVDVRTPAEYAHAHIPGAVSLPVLHDEEHAAVSTEYTHGDKAKARAMGVRFVAKRLPDLFERFQELTSHHEQVVLYCWRGGYRSHALFGLLLSLGVPVYKLAGGYKDYRKFVNRSWEAALAGKQLTALYGDTGTGKTELLHALDARGEQVVDLEQLAVHRGSLLGAIGLPAQPSQKMFESLLQKRLFALNDGPVFIEGESRKIGNLFLPPQVYQALQNAEKIEITSPLALRILRLKQEYAGHPPEEIAQALSRLEPMIGKGPVQKLLDGFAQGRTDEVIRTLLERYYDPKYHHREKRYIAQVHHENTDSTAAELVRLVR